MGIFGSKAPEPKPGETPASARLREPAVTPAPGPVAAPAPAAATAAGRASCVIGAKTVIKGEIGGDESIVVEGRVEGQIRIGRDLHVAQGGVVKASVDAQAVVIAGEIVGDVNAAARVEIQATGRLIGNIRAPKVVIVEGALFKGNSDMSGREHK